ncbi:Serine/threonine transporter SstT [Caprobacter fermentans]|uniref:Dicarboxylate/amino acid:cation symporter n=1 Tax=Caproicibacter fermentans TaxID=2576756 RepID=A0A6N8HWY3_9FIRM|nr:dicarboxylate/amino acid:cation symporter [Caproicibacter fermentans]MVB10189.1 Serine/threonine transporter SstT [Caproicibacter fermentans]OCN00853.1 sodium:proton antiporter [Clostridium sp. W14A]QNK41778.1 dicarboxylate/amino acid:cation symporter [Caproicibacter fermentans]
MKSKLKRLGLLPKLLIAIFIGTILGLTTPRPVIGILATFNSLFGNFLEFSIPLIIIGFVVPGISNLGKGAGKILGITVAIAYISTVIAGSLAYFADSSAFPLFLKAGAVQLDASDPSKALVPAYFTIQMDPIMGVVPALLISFVLGLGASALKGDSIRNVFSEFGEIIARLIEKIILPLLPIYVLGVFANLTFTGKVFEILSVFIKVYGIVLILHCCILLIQYAVAGTVTKRNPLKLLKNMLPAYVTALGTQSSAATIPVTLARTKLNKVSDDVASFVVPLCATIHMSGSTITITSCSIAVLMLNGTPITIGKMYPFILMLGVTMVAAAGVPGGCIMAALGILQSMLGFNQTMLSLMIALYLAQDSFGTACNVTGDGAIAILMDKIKENTIRKKNKVPADTEPVG